MKLDYRIFLLGLLIFASCKKYDNPPPVFEERKADSKIRRKMLLISIDGVGGDVLKQMAPPTMKGLEANSKYTYSMFKSAVATDAASWVSMLVGASFPKHNISASDFQIGSSGGDHGGINTRNTYLELINIYQSVPTAVVTPWPALRNYLKVADIKPEVNTDVAVKDSTIAILGRSNSMAAMVVNFRGAVTAGQNGTGGFTTANSSYTTAITAADTYVKEILEAVKKRQNYANEEWLVVITTNHGGSEANPTSGFLFAHYPTLKGEEFKKFGFSTVSFSGTNVFATADGDNGLYDAANDRDFTIQFQMKMVSASPLYNGFISKGTGYLTSGVESGWTLSTWANTWRPVYDAGVGGNQANINDGAWHTLTVAFKRVNATTRTIFCYTDGIAGATSSIHGKNMTTTNPFTVGYRNVDNYTGANFYIANLVYFDAALEAPVIASNLNKPIEQHPNFNQLIGYWKMDEGAESLFKNYAPRGVGMNIRGPFQWVSLGRDAPSQSTFAPVEAGTSVAITSSDVGALALYWMNLTGDADLDGRAFLKDYELEFLKR